MRESLLFPGVVLLILMVLFAFIPLPYPASGTVDTTGSLVVHPPSFPYSQESPITLSWNGGNSSTWIELLPCEKSDCSDIKPSTATPNPVPAKSWKGMGYGASGAINFWVPTNESFLIVTNAPNSNSLSVTVTWNEMPEFGFVWEILAIIGLVLALLGMFLPERGAPRGHQRRLHYHHWRHHSFALPPHLPSAGLTCAACGLTDIPHEDDYCPRCHAALPRYATSGPAVGTYPATGPAGAPAAGAPPAGAPSAPVAAAAPAYGAGPSAAPSVGVVDTAAMAAGGAAGIVSSSTYAAATAPSAAPPTQAAPAPSEPAPSAEGLPTEGAPAPPKKRTAVNRSKVAGQSLSVADADPMRPWRVVKGLGFSPEEVLVFTREDPMLLQERYALIPDRIYSITRTEGERAVSPGEGDRIADVSEQHLRSHPGGVVVLTDPNYIMTHVGFDSLQRLSHALQDLARECKGTFILAFNPQVLSAEQRAHMEERMRKVLPERK